MLFRQTGLGYEWIGEEKTDTPHYVHRLCAYAWGIIDEYDDYRHIHHVESVPWLNTEENLSAEEPDRHGAYHLHDAALG